MSATVLTRRPLAISESYTQDKQDRFNDARPVGSVRGLIYADQAGAFYLEESDNDGASWTTTATVAVSASVTAPLAWTGLTKRWYRFRYANGATAQAKFILIQHSRDMELGDVQLTGSNLRQTQIGTDQTATWANSAAANTQVSVTITKPTVPVGEYELIIYNPSTVTDLTIKVFAVEAALGGGARDALITTIPVLKSQAITGTIISAYVRIIHGIFNGADCKLVISNDTALGAAEGFTAYIRLREVM